MGLFTIGGGMAMLPLIQQLVVDKGWLDEEEAVDCIAVSQALPGVVAINAATYIGKKTCGTAGAIVATLGVIMPSFIIIIIMVTLLGTITENTAVKGAFQGVKAAVCGLVVISAVRLGKKVLNEPITWCLAIAAFIAVVLFDITAFWGIIAGGAAGIIYRLIWKNRRNKS